MEGRWAVFLPRALVVEGIGWGYEACVKRRIALRAAHGRAGCWWASIPCRNRLCAPGSERDRWGPAHIDGVDLLFDFELRCGGLQPSLANPV